MEEILMSPSDFVAVFNQSVSVSFPQVLIEGEISNFRLAKGKWVYFDIKDEYSSIRVFGTVFQLKHAFEDGMLVRLKARPELHPQYNFSLQIVELVPSGEGSIKKSFDLLQAKLTKEGLFDESRKRPLPYPPERIGLITSSEAAAYGDFIKILTARWPLVEVELIDVRVQGGSAAAEINQALNQFNTEADPVEVVVVIRGGGSADDLVAFSDEELTRSIASSRIPTLVAIGHERDLSLAELAADVRASTPSNAAELLVPDASEAKSTNLAQVASIYNFLSAKLQNSREQGEGILNKLSILIDRAIDSKRQDVKYLSEILSAYDPAAVLKRGYSMVRAEGKLVRSASQVKNGENLDLVFHDGQRQARVIG